MAVDASDRGFLREGVGEGKVLFKIGKADHEVFFQDTRSRPEIETSTYFLHPRDPQTLTIITLRQGLIANIERKIAR